MNNLLPKCPQELLQRDPKARPSNIKSVHYLLCLAKCSTSQGTQKFIRFIEIGCTRCESLLAPTFYNCLLLLGSHVGPLGCPNYCKIMVLGFRWAYLGAFCRHRRTPVALREESASNLAPVASIETLKFVILGTTSNVKLLHLVKKCPPERA